MLKHSQRRGWHFHLFFLSAETLGRRWLRGRNQTIQYSLICCTAICCCWCCWCAAAAAVAAAWAAACALSTCAVSSPPTSPPSRTSTPPSAPLEYNPIIITTALNTRQLSTKLKPTALRNWETMAESRFGWIERRFHFMAEKKKQNTICLHSAKFPANTLS